jgi:integrase
MAGRRALTPTEERILLATVRRLRPRERALITTQWFTGFRISEVLSLKVGQVQRDGAILPRIGIAPRHLKGHYGTTRSIPVLPELERALKSHLHWLNLKYAVGRDTPVFPSQKLTSDGALQPIQRARAAAIIKGALLRAGIPNDRLGTHSLRKTFARSVYEQSGNDIMVLRCALGHSDVSVSQRYLEVSEDAVNAAIARCDFTRRPRKAPSLSTPIPKPKASPRPRKPSPKPLLPHPDNQLLLFPASTEAAA